MSQPTGGERTAPSARRLPGRTRELLGRGGTREIALYLGGEIGSRLLTFAALIALANLVAPREFGLAALYFGLSNLAAIVLSLGLPSTVVRFYFENIPFSSVLGSISLLMAASAAVGLAVVVVAAAPIAAFLGIPESLLMACLAGGTAIAFRSSWTASLRARRRSVAYATTLLVEPLLGIVIVFLWLLAAGHVDHLTIAWSFAAAAAATAITGIVLWVRDPGLRWEPATARHLLVFSFPLIFHAFAMYALGTFDQVVINQTLGAQATGQYAYAYRWGMAMTALTAAFASLWNPRFQELVRSDAGRARLDGMATRGLGALAAAAVVLMLVLPIAARPFTPPAFLPALSLVPIVTYAYVWFALYTAVIGYAIYAKRTSRIAGASITIVAITIAANYLLVPRLGIGIAAVTSVLAFAGLFASQWWLVRDIARDIRYGRLAVGAIALGVIPLVEWFIV